MRARSGALLGVVLLVGLAGCGGLLPGGGGDYPAGTDADGVTNATTVLTNHQQQLAEDSYRIRYETLYAQPGDVGNTTAITTSNASQERQFEAISAPSREIDVFRNTSRSVSRFRLSNQTSYDAQGLGGSFADRHRNGARPGEMLTTIVTAGNYTANRTEARDGRTVTTFRTTTPVENASEQLPEDIETFNATLQVDEDGRVWHGEVFAIGLTNGTEQLLYQEYRTLDVGNVTVPRPTWLDEASAD